MGFGVMILMYAVLQTIGIGSLVGAGIGALVAKLAKKSVVTGAIVGALLGAAVGGIVAVNNPTLFVKEDTPTSEQQPAGPDYERPHRTELAPFVRSDRTIDDDRVDPRGEIALENDEREADEPSSLDGTDGELGVETDSEPPKPERDGLIGNI